MVHTQTLCVPLLPGKTTCFGRKEANLEKPTLQSEKSSLNL